MKNILKYTFLCTSLLALFFACNDDYIDGVSEVDPGPDQGAPTINIIYPGQDGQISSYESVIPITISFNVQDDIEIKDVVVAMDGVQIAHYTEFLDYRNFIVDDLVYENLTTGIHELTIIATDDAANQTTATSTFEKVPPYSPIFDNESLYMPFDGDFYDLISITEAGEVGNPGFLGTGRIGNNSYVPGTNNYITVPSEGLMSQEFSGSFWYKVNSSPDRAGIITIGPNDTDRTQGFRLFREGSATSQRIKLNVGTGSGESWNDGDVIDVDAGEWVHIAFTISNTQTIIYFNGVPVNSSTMANPIDWAGCTSFSIGSGEPTFAYWNHLSDTSAIDDLRFFSTALTMDEVQAIVDSAYEPILTGESVYMNFEGTYTNLVNGVDAGEFGNPSFADQGYNSGSSFLCNTDSYLIYPIAGIFGTDAFSVTFWYKVNSSPDRAGILTVGDDEADRMQGFRLFREGSAMEQRIKLNVGTGTGESWNDGGVIDASTGDWVHVAVVVSSTDSKIYFNNIIQNEATLSAPVDWTGCSDLDIGAGGPTFSYWNHLSDASPMDDLRIFNRAITEDEIATIMAN